jgi:hypothetical protein
VRASPFFAAHFNGVSNNRIFSYTIFDILATDGAEALATGENYALAELLYLYKHLENFFKITAINPSHRVAKKKTRKNSRGLQNLSERPCAGTLRRFRSCGGAVPVL